MVAGSGRGGSDRARRYAYERGDGRFKHRWNRDEAGFEVVDGRRVGRCHRSIDQKVAGRLLRGGVPEPLPLAPGESAGSDEHPRRIFNIYRGVPYVAVPTRPGISYHGYPWHGRMDPRIRAQLAARAAAAGPDDEKVFKRWLKEHGQG